ncbi:MAG: hypothetical protein KAQ91_01725, partial [Methylococcales bacterium]|nr:hypothetical protein [Methylococcales bacterium]
SSCCTCFSWLECRAKRRSITKILVDRWQHSFFRGHFLSKFRVLPEFVEHPPASTEFGDSLL